MGVDPGRFNDHSIQHLTVRPRGGAMSKSRFESIFKNCDYYSYNMSFSKRLLALKPWSPYCTTCNKWVRVRERMIGIPVADEVLFELHESDTVKRLLDCDWSVVNAADRVQDWVRQPIIFMGVGRCAPCDGPLTVFAEVHGSAGGTLYTGGIFRMEIENDSALELLELVIDRDLMANKASHAAAVELCSDLGSRRRFLPFTTLRERKQEASKYGLLGTTDLNNDRLGQAETNFRKALEIVEEVGDIGLQALAHMNLGNVTHKGGELERAEMHLRKALGLFEQLNSQADVALTSGFLATVYTERREFDRAEQYLRRALEINTALGHKPGVMTGYQALGDLQAAQHQREQARKAYDEALELGRQLSDVGHIAVLQAKLDELDS